MAYKQADCTVLTGSNLDHLPTFADCVFDSCVTDPPYELGFMGKAWDKSGIAYNVGMWREVFRVLKPGAYLLAFGGSRTYHRMACAIEDAGFEIRDQIQWIYGSGFPKSLDVSKAIDKMNGDERPIVGRGRAGLTGGRIANFVGEKEFNLTSAASAASAAWDGWGTALKPAFEPLVVGYKPLVNIDDFAIMVREVITNLCQSKSLVEIAKKSFQSNLPEQNVELNTAQWIAERSINTPDVLFDLMDMCQSELGPSSSLNTVLLWLDTLAAICSSQNTFTIETKSSLIIDLKILNSLPLPNILERIITGETLPNGDDTSVYTADNIFNAVSSKLKYILEHSAPETAISKAGQKGLRPNHEPIVMARKPLEKGLTVAQNVLKWGTGAINVDGCRIETNGENPKPGGKIRSIRGKFESVNDNGYEMVAAPDSHTNGRFPANVIHDGSDEVLAGFPETTSGKVTSDKDAYGNGSIFLNGVSNQNNQHGDEGSAARFFYSPKASKYDREAGLPEAGLPEAGRGVGALRDGNRPELFKLRDDLTDQERAFVLAELKKNGVIA